MEDLKIFLTKVDDTREAIISEMSKDEFWLLIPKQKRSAIQNILILYDEMRLRLGENVPPDEQHVP